MSAGPRRRSPHPCAFTRGRCAPWATIGALALGASTMALACASSPPAAPDAQAAADPLAGWRRARSAEGGFVVSLPGPPRAKRAHEGPVRMQLLSSEDDDGTVFEV